MALDIFEVRVDAVPDAHWFSDTGYKPIELWINGIGLIDVIRDVEMPHALREYDDRIAAGETEEDLGPSGEMAGNYMYLFHSEVYLPSRNLLGEPYPHGFVTASDDPRSRKSALLQCTCGITDCWLLLATITVAEDTVVWSDFCQFHRDWKYDLRPFVFDRFHYEAQLVAP